MKRKSVIGFGYKIEKKVWLARILHLHSSSWKFIDEKSFLGNSQGCTKHQTYPFFIDFSQNKKTWDTIPNEMEISHSYETKAVMIYSTHEQHVSCTLQTVLVFYTFVGSWVISVSGLLGNGIRGKSYIVCLFVTEEIPITVSRRAQNKEAWPSPYHYCS